MAMNLYLDPVTNDLYVTEDGQLRLTSNNSEEVSQRISCTLRTFLGEWFLNRSIGVPYFQEILGKANDLSKVRSIFAAKISSVPGVESILRLDTGYMPGERRYSVSFEVAIPSGEIVSGEVTA